MRRAGRSYKTESGAVPPGVSAKRRPRRGPWRLFREFVVAADLKAALEDVAQTRQNRQFRAASRLAEALPVRIFGASSEMAHETGGEEPARELAGRRVTRELPRELSADRRDGRAGDVRIGAGDDDLMHNHWQRSLGWRGVSAQVF